MFIWIDIHKVAMPKSKVCLRVRVCFPIVFIQVKIGVLPPLLILLISSCDVYKTWFHNNEGQFWFSNYLHISVFSLIKYILFRTWKKSYYLIHTFNWNKIFVYPFRQHGVWKVEQCWYLHLNHLSSSYIFGTSISNCLSGT